MYVPLDFEVPLNEPVRLPPSNPAELDELNVMIANNRLNQWKYIGKCLYTRNPDGTEKFITISGIDAGMLNAYLKGKMGAWPMPGKYQTTVWPPAPPLNCVSVIQYPS